MSFWKYVLEHSPLGNASTKRGKELPSFRERLDALGNLPRMFRMIWDISPGMCVATVLLRLVAAGLPLAMLYVGKLIIDEIVGQVNTPGEQPLERLYILLGIELGLAVISDLLSRAIALIDGLLGDLFSNKISVRLIDHAAVLDLDHFEDAEFYDKLERARRQTTGRTVLMSDTLSQIQDAITIAFLAVALIIFNPWLILLLLVALVPAMLGETHFNTRNYSLIRRWTPERRMLDYLRYTGASDETAKEVKIFGLSDTISERYDTLAMKYYVENKSLSTRRAAWGGMLTSIGSIGYYTAYVIIALQTVSGMISIGDLTFLTGSFSRLRGLLQNMLIRFTRLAEGALYLNDLFDFFELEPNITTPESPAILSLPFKEGFVFENVSFKYPRTNKWALRNLSFELHAGEKLALVGENGAGKTTLVKLLSRLYDPTEGRILLEGRDLKEYDINDLRKQVGVIFQDYVRYNFTANDNIAIGQIEALKDRPRIEDAAARSLASSVIEKLPGQYDQVLGRRFEDGVDLSGGEWQKVALARAYLRDAQLLILDEPTASLDARAEHNIFQRFTELTAGKTAVLISHRFSTVRMADRILVIENGTRLEIGTHDELIALNGRYAELFGLQAEGYR